MIAGEGAAFRPKPSTVAQDEFQTVRKMKPGLRVRQEFESKGNVVVAGLDKRRFYQRGFRLVLFASVILRVLSFFS